MSDTCFLCHGPDAGSRQANLRLDLREEALKPADSGKIPIVPGQPDASEIIRRLETADKDELMPPVDAHKTLSAQQKSNFREWVKQGAVYEEHWAYKPLQRPQVPAIDNQSLQNEFGHGAIDTFILQKLAEKNMTPSPKADKRTLLRRLSLDLVGLPPTPEELKAFLNDQSPDAWEKQVDRLLQSPHFGERMAVWWLDVARFTDTVGYHGDQNQRIFPYRDYVINAFNRNLPFDQFTLEQLAGDLLPDPTTDQLVATGFNRLNMMTREGGAQTKEYLAKYGADRVRTIGTAWLGSTMGCCECHNHKFDPFGIRDFYSMQAFFADVKQYGVYNDYGYTPEPELKGFNNESPFPPEMQVESPYLKSHQTQLQSELNKLAEQFKFTVEHDPEQLARFTTWKAETLTFLEQHPDGWMSCRPEAEFVSIAAKKPQPKKAVIPTDDRGPPPLPEEGEPAHSKVTDQNELIVLEKSNADLIVSSPMSTPIKISALRVEMIPHAENQGELRRDQKPNEISTVVTAEIRSGNKQPTQQIKFHMSAANHFKPQYSSGEEDLGVHKNWMTNAADHQQLHTAVFWCDRPVELKAGDHLRVKLKAGSQIGCVRISISPFAAPHQLEEKSGLRLHELLSKTASDSVELLNTYLFSRAGLEPSWNEYRSTYNEKLLCRDGKTWTMVTKATTPLQVRILPRGNWLDETGDIVTPETPRFLPAKDHPANERLTRADLARWLCSNENPLTSRAVTNRLWKQFFGNGLSLVVDDLGAQGEPPSHPELLDWLAVEFREQGWDVKHLIKTIVMSETYQQASIKRTEYHDIDPNNRLLSYQNPRRLEAEFVRDNALAVTGLINLDIGGPSCFPYQPAGYYRELQFPNREYVSDQGKEQYRRGVYMHWQRTFLHPMLANFDAPNRDECTANRNNSNTPQQALTLLNDPTFTEAARYLASRLIEQNTDSASRYRAAYLKVLSREPKPDEVQSLKDLETKLREYYQANHKDAELLQKTGQIQIVTHDPVEQAVWTNLCRVILNLHETITRY